MRRTIILLLCTILFGVVGHAKEEASAHSLLWRITGPRITKPSYLFGTIHLVCPDDYFWTDAMQKSLTASEKVCFELDMDDPNMLEEASAGLIDTSGKALKDYFTQAQYARLQRFLHDSIGVDISAMQMMKPLVLQTLFMAKAMSCGFPESYEANIAEEAKKTGKEVIGLETLQEQLNVFNSLSDDSVVTMVMQMVDSFAQSKKDYAQLLVNYKAQDLPALHKLVMESDELGQSLGAFLDERNKKWIPRMGSKMKEGSVFFAVGAAHLIGDAGVITLLRKAGYTVTPVR